MAGPEKVRASHLLIKHAGSRRPSSWKEVSLIRLLSMSLERDGRMRCGGREEGEGRR